MNYYMLFKEQEVDYLKCVLTYGGINMYIYHRMSEYIKKIQFRLCRFRNHSDCLLS